MVTMIAFCLVVSFISVTLADTVTVTVPNGQIMGTTVQSSVTSSRTYWAFYSVRYAEPPLGKYRFLAPAELQPWDGVYDATAEKGICYSSAADLSTETEDCLFAYIYTPRDPLDQSSDLLPVMFHIPGGGFVQGSGGINGGFGPDFFMDYDVMIVSINYRLNAFGFLGMNDTVIPGNAGLKDQLLALKWVNENIKYFGGDPNRITIFGESAGAASVSYHLLSPQSAGLFQAAILQSGSALSPWAYQRDQKYWSLITAGLINPAYNASGVTSEELLANLQAVDAKQIDNAATTVGTMGGDDDNEMLQGFFYAPVIEAEHDGAFLTSYMYELFASGQYNKVPVLLGTNSEEGLIYYADWTHWMMYHYDLTPEYLVPHDMHVSDSIRPSIGTLVTKEYTPNAIWQDNIAAGIRYYTDTMFARSILKQAQLQSSYNDVYFYEFTYHGEMGGNTITLEGTGNVTHGEEVSYLFTRGYNTNVNQFPQTDQNVHYRFMSFWTNFAKYYDPVPTTSDLIPEKWPKVTSSNFQYMDIGAELTVGVNPKGEIYNFWTNLYDTYGVRPFDSY